MNGTLYGFESRLTSVLTVHGIRSYYTNRQQYFQGTSATSTFFTQAFLLLELKWRKAFETNVPSSIISRMNENATRSGFPGLHATWLVWMAVA